MIRFKRFMGVAIVVALVSSFLGACSQDLEMQGESGEGWVEPPAQNDNIARPEQAVDGSVFTTVSPPKVTGLSPSTIVLTVAIPNVAVDDKLGSFPAEAAALQGANVAMAIYYASHVTSQTTNVAGGGTVLTVTSSPVLNVAFKEGSSDPADIEAAKILNSGVAALMIGNPVVLKYTSMTGSQKLNISGIGNANANGVNPVLAIDADYTTAQVPTASAFFAYNSKVSIGLNQNSINLGSIGQVRAGASLDGSFFSKRGTLLNP